MELANQKLPERNSDSYLGSPMVAGIALFLLRPGQRERVQASLLPGRWKRHGMACREAKPPAQSENIVDDGKFGQTAQFDFDSK